VAFEGHCTGILEGQERSHCHKKVLGVLLMWNRYLLGLKSCDTRGDWQLGERRKGQDFIFKHAQEDF
jgi:hypothetical protein